MTLKEIIYGFGSCFFALLVVAFFAVVFFLAGELDLALFLVGFAGEGDLELAGEGDLDFFAFFGEGDLDFDFFAGEGDFFGDLDFAGDGDFFLLGDFTFLVDFFTGDFFLAGEGDLELAGEGDLEIFLFLEAGDLDFGFFGDLEVVFFVPPATLFRPLSSPAAVVVSFFRAGIIEF